MVKKNQEEKNRFDLGFINVDEISDTLQPESPASSDKNLKEIDNPTNDDEYFDGYFDALDEVDTLSSSISDTSILKKREDTRGRLATIYTLATFFIFLVALIIAVIDGIHRGVSIIENISQIIPVISGVFLGTLGFVLGYYFRKEDE